MRIFRQHLPRLVSVLFALVTAAVLTACASDSQPKSPPPQQDPNQFPLRVGDKVKVELTGIPELIEGKEQDVHDDGAIVLPYIGRVLAAGKSASALEQEITAAYVPRYYTHISVTVTPVARFFYVGGMVNNNGPGGRIVWAGPITIMGAIQAAGDFTPFAKKGDVQVTRGDQIIHVNCNKALKNPKLDIPIYPGDRIWVSRRL